MATAPRTVAPDEPDVYYPSSDGKPLGETEFHIDAILLLYQTLKVHFRRRPVYVAADMFLYYKKGDPSAVKAPDLMAIKNVSKHRRRTFKTWEEKAVPCVIVEFVSETTVDEDFGAKKDLYAQLSVREYFVFDPEQKWMDPPLQGFRLRGKKYVPIPPAADGSVTSQELGLRLLAEGEFLRVINAKTGKRLQSPEERMVQARQRAQQARRAKEQAEQRADQERLAKEQAQQRADQERQRADQERQRADQERLRADALAAELERLRAAQEGGEQKPE
jgi:Uma2 family endonuclease